MSLNGCASAAWSKSQLRGENGASEPHVMFSHWQHDMLTRLAENGQKRPPAPTVVTQA